MAGQGSESFSTFNLFKFFHVKKTGRKGQTVPSLESFDIRTQLIWVRNLGFILALADHNSTT